MRFADAVGRADRRAGGDTTTRWLAVGPTAARALKEARVRVRKVADVHGALETLDAGAAFAGCLIDARCLEARPGAALDLLRLRMGADRVVVVGDRIPAALKRAARRFGVALCRPPEDGGIERLRVRALPRADAAPVEAEPISTGAFARRCFAHVGDASALLQYTAHVLAAGSKASRVSVMLRDDDCRTLSIRHAVGLDESLVDTIRIPMGRGIAGRAAAVGRPLTGRGTFGGTREYAGTAYVVLPLGQDGDCIGTVNLTGFPADAVPEPKALARWASIAHIAGQALAIAYRLERAEMDSTTDALTGLPNRRAFYDALAREVDRATRSGDGLAVALFDADHFKTVNDTYGHQAGDRVLATLAERLRKAFRQSDLLARWGGEEFAVLLPGLRGARPESSLRALDRARRNVSAQPIALGAGLPAIFVTVSGGVGFHPANGRDGEALVHAADAALREAKDAGRNAIRSCLPGGVHPSGHVA